MVKFSDRFSELRKSRGYTQASIADKLGVSRSTIGMYESGKREPDFNGLECIADLFNVDMDYLTGRSEVTTVIKSNTDEQIDILIDFEKLTSEQRDAVRHLMAYYIKVNSSRGED